MTNNDILRRIRFIFNLNDKKMIKLFENGDFNATRAQISDWMKKEDDSAYQSLPDQPMASFLNGFIIDKRGRKDGQQPVAENALTNNIIFMKLKIALNLKAEDILSILGSSDLEISKHELSAFFRKRNHKHFRVCKDQVLRNFLAGLQLKHADSSESDEDTEDDGIDNGTPVDNAVPAFQWKKIPSK